LLLAATVQSFAHMPLGFSDRNSHNLSTDLSQAEKQRPISYCMMMHLTHLPCSLLAFKCIVLGNRAKIKHISVVLPTAYLLSGLR